MRDGNSREDGAESEVIGFSRVGQDVGGSGRLKGEVWWEHQGYRQIKVEGEKHKRGEETGESVWVICKESKEVV
jgi:hypothetical protein